MRRKATGIVIIFALIGGSISGCGRANKDEIIESLNDQNDIASGTDANESDIVSEIPEHITYNFSSNAYEINVDADVFSTGYENAQIYETTKKVVDDKYLADLAGGIFDEGEYEIIRPYNLCNKEVLFEEKIFFEELIESSGEYTVSTTSYCSLADIDTCLYEYDENKVKNFDDNQIIVEWDLSVQQADEELIFDVARLRGKINGEWWELYYRKNKSTAYNLYGEKNGVGNSSGIGAYTIGIHPIGHDHSWGNTVSMDEMNENLYNSNKTNLDKAKDIANDFIYKMDIGDMDIVHTAQILHTEIIDTEDNIYMDGYKFVYGKKAEGIAVNYIENSSVGYLQSGEDGTSQEYVSVYVVGDSLDKVIIGSGLYELGAKMSDNSNMLSFEQVDAIAQDYMKNDLTVSEYKKVFDIDKISLCYLTLSYDGSKYCMMPVWIYYNYFGDSFGYGDFSSAAFGVNAVDGSILYFNNVMDSHSITGYFILPGIEEP